MARRMLAPWLFALTSAQVDPPAAQTASPSAPSRVQPLVVTAARPKAQVLIDRTVYAVGGDLQRSFGVASDILNQIPSVDVDADGNVSLRGDSNVTILVDGKPSAQFSGAAKGVGLQQFPARDIERIEVMTNPPARYKAEGSAGVINIITRRSKARGLSGDMTASLGDKRRFVVGLDATYRSGRLGLSGGLSFRQEARERLIADQRAADDPSTGAPVFSRETIDEHVLRRTPQGHFGLDYALGDRDSLSLGLSHREQTGQRFFEQADTSAGPTGVPLADSLRHSDGHEWNETNGRTARLDHRFARPDEQLSLSFHRSAYRERERYAYLNTYDLPVAPRSRDDLHLSNDLVTTGVDLDYTLPLSHDRRLEVGYDFEDDDDHFDNRGDTIDPATGLPVDNPDITSHYRFRQDIHTLYGQYESPLGRWTLQSGARLEWTRARGVLLNGDVATDEAYFRAYPTLTLERKFGEAGTLSLSAARRIDRPDPELLNPFVDYQDTHNLRAGDAHLLPRDVWKYAIGWRAAPRALEYGVTAYYQFNRDSVTDVVVPIAADVTLATKANLPKSKSAGLELSASGRLSRPLSYTLSGDLFWSQIDASALGAGGGLRATEGFDVKASLDWKPTAADAFQASFSRTDRRLTAQGSLAAINLVNLGYRRRLGRGLSTLITLSDALDGQRYARDIVTPALNDAYSRHQLGRVAYVGVVWDFGVAGKARPRAFDYDP